MWVKGEVNGMTKEYVIHDGTFGHVLIEAESSLEALLDYVCSKAKGEARREIKVVDGIAEITRDGTTYRAVPRTKEEAA
jgi:hypothetical protein